MEHTVRGLIVAAGYGTRFLPVTKTIPKEMLPLIDKPSIAFIVEEFLLSGIKDIVIITSRRKKALEDYFDREMELENLFQQEGAEEKLKAIQPADCNITFVRQQEMRGTGHALLLAEPWLKEGPFVAAYPDDLHFGPKPLAAQLIEKHRQTLGRGFERQNFEGQGVEERGFSRRDLEGKGCERQNFEGQYLEGQYFGSEGASVLATLHNPPDLHRYGVLKLAESAPKTSPTPETEDTAPEYTAPEAAISETAAPEYATGTGRATPDFVRDIVRDIVMDIVEKPAPGTEPGREASIGRYLYTPELFYHLKRGWELHPSSQKEYFHTYALRELMKQKKVVYTPVQGERLDIGTPEGYLRAILRYAAMDPKLQSVLAEMTSRIS